MKEKLHNGNLKIEEYSFHDFLVAFAEALAEGYKLNLEDNETFPQKYGDYLSVILVPAVVVAPDQNEAVVADGQVEAPAKPVKAPKAPKLKVE